MAEAALENPDLYDLTMSDEAQPLLDRVKKHVKENVDPWSEEYHALGREQAKIDRWDHHPRQVELMEAAKQKAAAEKRKLDKARMLQEEAEAEKRKLDPSLTLPTRSVLCSTPSSPRNISAISSYVS